MFCVLVTLSYVSTSCLWSKSKAMKKFMSEIFVNFPSSVSPFNEVSGKHNA